MRIYWESVQGDTELFTIYGTKKIPDGTQVCLVPTDIYLHTEYILRTDFAKFCFDYMWGGVSLAHFIRREF